MDTKKAREYAYQLTYETEVRYDSPKEVLKVFFETNKFGEKTREYITSIVCGVYEQKEQLDAEIGKYLKDWKIERISRLSLSAIRLAMFEMQNNKMITPAIAISEAVSLAVKFEGEEAASFVNGVLGQYAKSE